MSELDVMELCWLFCKRAREHGMDDDRIRWVLDQALERFDSFEFLTRVSVNQIGKEEEV